MAKKGVEIYHKKVIDATKKTARVALSSLGAYGRRVSRNSMKMAGKSGSKKGNASRPGRPPYYHKRTQKQARLKESIWYAIDDNTESMVLGAAKDIAGRSAGADALEHGGSVDKKTLIYAPESQYKKEKKRRARERRQFHKKLNSMSGEESSAYLVKKYATEDQREQQNRKRRQKKNKPAYRPQGYRYFYSKELKDDAFNSKNGRIKAWAEKQKSKRKREYKTERIDIKPRPFIVPAMTEAIERLPDEFFQAQKRHFK